MRGRNNGLRLQFKVPGSRLQINQEHRVQMT